MTVGASLPRHFGSYLLTALLGQDALGRVFRALRVSGDRGFVRLRVFEASEVSEDAVLDAIEENGEIHSFLKNPAIARGVQMDAVEGIPFLAWNEPNGRTLDALIARAREHRQGIPVEHALLISEKIATALDHAYNTTVDGERTLHGLVWPGFVSVSDDGETRLTGFGLASGFFPSMSRPRFAREIAPYVAPEERANLVIAKNSDVFSVGVLLFELLFGRLPSLTDPLGDLKTASGQAASIAPEATAVLRTCLAPADSRYQSSGELRRELGKILFSGPYSPSTFNLAFFISSLFGTDIEAENRARALESALDPETIQEMATLPRAPAPSPLPVQTQPPAPPARRPYALGGVLLLAAALAGTIFLITRRTQQGPRNPVAPVIAPSTPSPPPTPELTSAPATAVTESQFKEEVARRVAADLKRLEGQMRKTAATPAVHVTPPSRSPSAEPTVLPAFPRREPRAEATPQELPTRVEATAVPTLAPTAAAERTRPPARR